MALDISIKETNSQVFQVSLTGMLGTDTYESLENSLKDILPDAIAMVFDLGGLYISSMGLRTLAIVRKTMSEKNGSFLLVNPQAPVKAVFDVTKIFSDNLMASLDEADTMLDSYLDQVQKGEIKPRIRSIE